MKITCPSCAAEYNVPGTLAAGRVVRCAKCGTEWTPVPPDGAEPPPSPPPPEPEPKPGLAPLSAAMPEPPARLAPPPPPAEQRQWSILAAWLGSGVVIVAALTLAFVFRAPVMQAWPPSQRVYAALGLQEAASPHVNGDVVK